MGSKNNWDADAMQGTLISDMEQEVRDGVSQMDLTNTHQTPEPAEQPEPTKGVQTYIPMSLYRRLNDIKLTRGENIAALAAQAIELWVDVQEGKKTIEH